MLKYSSQFYSLSIDSNRKLRKISRTNDLNSVYLINLYIGRNKDPRKKMCVEIPINNNQQDSASSYLLTPEEAIEMERVVVDGLIRRAPGMRAFLSESKIPYATNLSIRAARKAIWSSVDPRLVPLDRLAFLLE